MGLLKKIIFGVFLLLVLLSTGAFFYVKHQKPTYKGKLKLVNIKNPVEVYYDSIGVPHIFAKNQKDAFTAMGYVHAQDRLWQMELLRRIAAGRLSEIFGKHKEPNDNLFLKTDKFFLGLGIEETGLETISKLDTTSKDYQLMLSYLKGVNQFIENGPKPIEYSLIGIKQEKFTIKDIYNVLGYMSFSFAMAHKTDPLVTNIQKKYGLKYLQDLALNVDSITQTIPIHDPNIKIESEITTQVDKIMDNMLVSPFIGSNSWVVGPNKTKHGKVIFANDPHINYSQPSVWYQMHVVCPDYEMYGFHLGLIPFPLLGHNKNYAYGLTMFENDDIDFYQEKLNPDNSNEYSIKDKVRSFKIKEKIIKIKGGKTEKLNVRYSIHGPVMNDLIEGLNSKSPITMYWIYTKYENKMLQALYKISHSKNINEFKNGTSKIHAPGLNVMYGDSEGNYAWFASAKLYKHKNNVNTFIILDGSNGIDDQIEYLDFYKNPKAINHPDGYVYSANNQPDSISGIGYYPGYYLPRDRAKRIVDKLSDMEEIERIDMELLINDVTSSILPELIPLILENISKKELTKNEDIALKTLAVWDGGFELNQVAPTIFTKFKYEFLKNTFKDELGEKGFKQFLETHLSKRQFEKQIRNLNSVWDDDILTKDKVETKRDIISKSFKETIAFLEKKHGKLISNWKWKNVHTVTFNHPIGDKLSFLGLNFNVGPFSINGSNRVLNNQIFDLNNDGDYPVTAGPSTRRVIDFNDIDNSVSILPTGQSGNVFSKHYKDQTEKFISGEFFKMLINKSEIMKLEDKLILIPK
jgi:penicillin amidase